MDYNWICTLGLIMAHFALLDENNKVLNVIKVGNDDVQNLEFPESEAVGIEFLKSIGLDGNWKQTSYNNNFRLRYAHIDGYYNPERDAFIHRKVFSAWILDNITLDWIPPVPAPLDGKNYLWHDDGDGTGYWVEAT